MFLKFKLGGVLNIKDAEAREKLKLLKLNKWDSGDASGHSTGLFQAFHIPAFKLIIIAIIIIPKDDYGDTSCSGSYAFSMPTEFKPDGAYKFHVMDLGGAKIQLVRRLNYNNNYAWFLKFDDDILPTDRDYILHGTYIVDYTTLK